MSRLTRTGLKFCYPTVSATDKEILAEETYDLALATKLVASNAPVVCNGFCLKDPERILVVSGPNQGGKTTFARTFGQLHHLASLGCPVPAKAFRASVRERIFTHYKREEDATMESGKLEEELSRMSHIIDDIVPNALVLFNEFFASTNEREGAEIARQVVAALVEQRIEVFFVTHQYEFAHAFERESPLPVLFLRAEREPDGARTFRISPGRPLRTSYGKDLYKRIFADDAEA